VVDAAQIGLWPSHRGTPSPPALTVACSIEPLDDANRPASPGVQPVSRDAPKSPFPTRRILGVDICVVDRDAAIAHLLPRLAARAPTKVAFANMHLLSQIDEAGFSARSLDDFIVLNDGVGLDVASLILYRKSFPENLVGTDFVPALLTAAGGGTRVFLYGSQPAIVEHAARIFAERYGVTICGTCDGFGVAAERAAVARRIHDSEPDIVLVALGNPQQEQWIAENATALGAPIAIGVGALFDIATEVSPRAPAWVRRVRLEWLYRLALEPSRLWHRYTVETFSFFYKILRQI
jgi:beta-1,4-glucosyltransferase